MKLELNIVINYTIFFTFCQIKNVSRIYKISKISKIGARDCSSGSPDPERVKRAAASPTVARGPVPRDHTTYAKTARRLRPFLVPTEAWRGPVPRPTVSSTLFYRSAGACPPRSFDLRKNRTPTKAVSLPTEAWRGTGPRPTVKRRRSCKP